MIELFESAVILKYQQPDKDLDALVSVVNDADVINMMEEYDKLGGNDGFTRFQLLDLIHRGRYNPLFRYNISAVDCKWLSLELSSSNDWSRSKSSLLIEALWSMALRVGGGMVARGSTWGAWENPVGLWKNAVEYSILENVAAMKIQHAFRNYQTRIKIRAAARIQSKFRLENVAAMKIQHAFCNYQTRIKIRAAARIQSKFRLENVAAMKIQHAFRNYQTRIKIRAAARIQSKFRTWKLRKDFLNMRFVKHSDNFVKHSVIYL
ncbi:hypothetical protein IFM89_035406 [Coptis chinensis]|uniref:PB1 domain-containing protein n=1 Tax=Coptis chinensis TaxID=261450 RepID=A0A835HIU7_9MAGN|nr:hypothetical protein IFM89_035406 [Coptis chinensis]